MLKAWEELPEFMQNDEVRAYYDILAKRKGHLLFKRVFDLVVASILLILCAPIMLILAIAIKVNSRGPVFFRQVRITQYGKEFRIFKFRTMVVDAEKIGTQVTVGNDPRITKVGHMIRKTRLDEIPQLLNVLKGEMSFVGTRPEVPKYVNQYQPEMMATLLMPAGITSKASIEFKDEEKILDGVDDVDKVYVEEVLPIKMIHNVAYIKKFTAWRDVKLMINTALAVIKKDTDVTPTSTTNNSEVTM